MPSYTSKIKSEKWHSLPPWERVCYYCACEMQLRGGAPNSATLDHLVPQSRGGQHTHGNTVLACLICNTMRADMPVDTFRAYLESDFGKQRYQDLVHKLKKKGKQR